MENTVYSVFKEIVKNNKNEIAIIENDRTLTFEELSEMVDMIADSFKDGTKSVGIVMKQK